MRRTIGTNDEPANRIIADTERARQRTMNRAVKLLAAKMRSVGELRERLLEKHWTNEEIVDTVIERLKSYDYLNDDIYAQTFALSKLRQKPQGRHRLRQALRGRELSTETVDAAISAAFETLPEDDLITAAIEKRLRVRGNPTTRQEVKNFYDHLLRLGFGYDLIRQKMEAIKLQASDEEDQL